MPFRSSERKLSFKFKFTEKNINLFGCKTLLQICNDKALPVFLLNVVTEYWKLLLQLEDTFSMAFEHCVVWQWVSLKGIKKEAWKYFNLLN